MRSQSRLDGIARRRILPKTETEMETGKETETGRPARQTGWLKPGMRADRSCSPRLFQRLDCCCLAGINHLFNCWPTRGNMQIWARTKGAPSAIW